MQSTTITLPPGLLERLRRIAAEEMSVEAVVREAHEEKGNEHRPHPG